MSEYYTPTVAQDDGPLIRGRSIMVGEHRVSESSRSRSRERLNVEFGDSTTGGQRKTGGKNPLQQSRPNISYLSRSQSQLAARRGRSRSDEEALAQSVADAGLNAFGCVFVELWVMSDDGTKLRRPNGGHWMKPAFAQSLQSEELIEKAWLLDREAGDCPPGAGLAGTLSEESGNGSGRVHWRQIKTLLNDPFVQRGEGRRMERLVELGLGLVACVSFSFQDGKGIVLYYSRSSANVEMLRSTANERYLVGSSDLVGANYTIRKAREHSSELRKNLFREAIVKVRREFLGEKRSFASMVLDPENMEKLRRASLNVEDAEENGLGTSAARVDRCAVTLAKKTYQFGVRTLIRINNSRRKWKGANLHGPPRQSLSESVFCFIGVFLTMLTILKVEKSIREDSDFEFDAGWYSSTLCIVFALTPAPVGQPRQIYLAHLWNILVGMACRQIPTGGFRDFREWTGASDPYGMPLIWVQALAVGLGVSGQAFIGILHPPATGLSLTFISNPDWTWSTIASIMVVDSILVTISMMYLNLSGVKQYPLFWIGLGWQGGGGTAGAIRSAARSLRRSAKSMKGTKMKGDEVV